MSPPINLDGDTVDAITIDGSSVNEVTVDGEAVFSAIPDSAVHQYDASTLSLSDGDSVSSWTDSIGTADASAVGGPTFQDNSLNGLPVVDFDGDDSFDASFSLSQPYSMTVVVELDIADGSYLWSSDTGGSHPHLQNLDSSTIRWDAGSQLDFNVNDYTGNYIIFTSIYNGSNSVLRRNGSSVGTGNAGTDGISSNFHIGERRGSKMNGRIAELVVYNDDISGQVATNEEQRLSDKWGVTIN